MKRLFIWIATLVVGATAFCGARLATQRQEEELLKNQRERGAVEQQAADLESQRMTLEQHWRDIRMDGLENLGLADAPCDVLAITPRERHQIESAAAQLKANYSAWVAAHLQRETPEGDVVARFTSFKQGKR